MNGQTTNIFKIDEHKTILSIYFAVSNSDVNEIQKEQIVSLVSKLDGKDITIKGYADSTGNAKFNQKLAHDRVSTIEGFIQLKFPKRALHSSWIGKDPLAHKHSLSEQRRVDIVLTTSARELQELLQIPSPPPPPPIKEVKKKIVTPKKKAPEEAFYDLMNSSDKIVFENVLFQPGKSKFQYNKTPNELYYLAEMMDKNPSMRIEVAGHVCCEDNQKLSEGRAKTVYLFLRAYGIDKSRVTYTGYSNSDPRVEELTPKDERLNRRVEIIVIER